jgi:hypothetical protein
MYNRDYSILYYSSTKQTDFTQVLKVHHTTFTKHLNEGTYYLGKYVFSRELLEKAKVVGMSLDEVRVRMEKDRVHRIRHQSLRIKKKEHI